MCDMILIKFLEFKKVECVLIMYRIVYMTLYTCIYMWTNEGHNYGGATKFGDRLNLWEKKSYDVL